MNPNDPATVSLWDLHVHPPVEKLQDLYRDLYLQE